MGGSRPSAAILAAFGAGERLQRLSGGQGTTYRSGQIILKPVDDPIEASWTAELFRRLSGPGFQVPSPIRGAEGWIVDGWSAWERFDGRHVTGRWLERMEVCDRFHGALAYEPRPDFLYLRDDPWSIADRMAWGEMPIECLPATRGYVDRLIPVLAIETEPNQIIHGDITENILVRGHRQKPAATGVSPSVIDLAPYWRPATFAKAVLVVDAITWRRASVRLIEASGVWTSMIARAALRRILEHDLHHQLRGRDTLGDLPAYERLVGMVNVKG